ncbi:hypothetical protein FGO68_gene6548 [Halteria grandinella]|uniref:Uncharacterized protein n=1 Tax=Halteria grandinella TaxID=5974 RepID=A0A8J8NE14_HALGN|nr:hypothetical protein FGO68_gene6548 [Halteria grandinella]
MNQGTLFPLQAKLSSDKPFYPILTTLSFDNPWSWNISLYIDIIKKSRGQISKLNIFVRDPFLNASVILEHVDPKPLRKFVIKFANPNDFINQQFFDCINALATNIQILEIHIIHMFDSTIFRENLDKLLPTLEYLHTFKFKPYHNSPQQLIPQYYSVPPCLLLGQPPHLTSLVLYSEQYYMNFSRLKGLLGEIQQGRKPQQGILKVKVEGTDYNSMKISLKEFKEIQQQYTGIELDIYISE